MKPHFETAPPRWLSRYDCCREKVERFPKVSFAFQAPRYGDDSGGSFPPKRPRFSGLAWEVLRTDANQSFRLETAVLGFVTLVSAWPIAVMIHEVIRLLR